MSLRFPATLSESMGLRRPFYNDEPDTRDWEPCDHCGELIDPDDLLEIGWEFWCSVCAEEAE